jgi:hypothetical protein
MVSEVARAQNIFSKGEERRQGWDEKEFEAISKPEGPDRF